MCPVPRTTNGDLVEDPQKAKDICSSDQNSEIAISDNNEGAITTKGQIKPKSRLVSHRFSQKTNGRI